MREEWGCRQFLWCSVSVSSDTARGSYRSLRTVTNLPTRRRRQLRRPPFICHRPSRSLRDLEAHTVPTVDFKCLLWRRGHPYFHFPGCRVLALRQDLPMQTIALYLLLRYDRATRSHLFHLITHVKRNVVSGNLTIVRLIT